MAQPDRTDHVLDLIDGAVGDWATSVDVIRWQPDGDRDWAARESQPAWPSERAVADAAGCLAAGMRERPGLAVGGYVEGMFTFDPAETELAWCSPWWDARPSARLAGWGECVARGGGLPFHVGQRVDVSGLDGLPSGAALVVTAVSGDGRTATLEYAPVVQAGDSATSTEVAEPRSRRPSRADDRPPWQTPYGPPRRRRR